MLILVATKGAGCWTNEPRHCLYVNDSCSRSRSHSDTFVSNFAPFHMGVGGWGGVPLTQQGKIVSVGNEEKYKQGMTVFLYSR